MVGQFIFVPVIMSAVKYLYRHMWATITTVRLVTMIKVAVRIPASTQMTLFGMDSNVLEKRLLAAQTQTCHGLTKHYTSQRVMILNCEYARMNDQTQMKTRVFK